MHIKVKNFIQILAFWSIFFGAGWAGKEFGLTSKAKKTTSTLNQKIESLISLNSI